MPRNNGPSGPLNGPPPPPPPPPLALYIPPGLTDSASDEQLAKIALVELDFAQKVAGLLTRSYGEVLSIVREPVETV